MNPQIGNTYLCKTRYGSTRNLSYGYHRKNNLNNFGPLTIPTRIVWVGWRDEKNGRFFRSEEIVQVLKKI